MTSSRSASLPSSASALGQEEQPWLVNSSTTAFGVVRDLARHAGVCCGRRRSLGRRHLREAGKTGRKGDEREQPHGQD